MKIQEVKQVLPILMKHGIVPFLWGQQGMGKTQVVKQIADSLELKVVHLHLATQEVGELIGLLTRNPDGTVSHSRPRWFPTEPGTIVFLDEFNRAHPDILQAVFNFVLNGSLHEHQLPKGCYIVAAGNYANENFNTTDMSDAALVSRFCHIDFTPSVEEFILYAEERKAFTVANFIRRYPEMLEVKQTNKPIFEMLKPDRRMFLDFVDKVEKEPLDSVRYELYSGMVGRTAAAAFIADKQKQDEVIKGAQLLEEYATNEDLQLKVKSISTVDSIRFDLLNQAVEEALTLFDSSTDKNHVKNLQAFLLDVPLEMGMKIINRLTESRSTLRQLVYNDQKFVKKFSELKIKTDELNKKDSGA